MDYIIKYNLYPSVHSSTHEKHSKNKYILSEINCRTMKNHTKLFKTIQLFEKYVEQK